MSPSQFLDQHISINEYFSYVARMISSNFIVLNSLILTMIFLIQFFNPFLQIVGLLITFFMTIKLNYLNIFIININNLLIIKLFKLLVTLLIFIIMIIIFMCFIYRYEEVGYLIEIFWALALTFLFCYEF